MAAVVVTQKPKYALGSWAQLAQKAIKLGRVRAHLNEPRGLSWKTACRPEKE